MRKQNRAIALLLAVFMLIGTVPCSAYAASDRLVISTPEEWLSFVKNCRIDNYSLDLRVELLQDIDLSGKTDASVPIFCGSFHGGGHTIYGLNIDAAADKQGLFRHLSEGAEVSDLNISADISGGTDGEQYGILCGINDGTITGCNVSGSISAYENVAGIAGINGSSGIITRCTSKAETEGTLRVGGIAGTNEGTIANCENNGSVCSVANEDATNIGGIAGVNDHVIKDCLNHGEIGYMHTGYNVGGLVGKNRGFVMRCENTADICGRRDVGGVAGQMEPSFSLEYGQNAMELLDSNISGFSGTLSTTAGSLQAAISNGAVGLSEVLAQIDSFARGLSADTSALFSNMTWISDSEVYLDRIRNEIQYIKDSLPGNSLSSDTIHEIEAILEEFDEDNPSAWPDLLTQLMEKLNDLALELDGYSWLEDSISRISESFSSLANTVIGGVRNFGEDSTDILENASYELSDITEQITAFLGDTQEDVGSVRAYLENALSSLNDLQAGVDKVLGGKTDLTVDLSENIENQADGMIVSCGNSGKVSGDYNIGGILGNLSFELSADQETDELPLSLDELLFTDTTTYIRATVYDCSNSGNAWAKYNYTGGILGHGNYGALMECQNSGNCSCGRNDAGGIAGYFRGTIRSCRSIGLIEGKSYIGGIAGDAERIESCMAIPEINADGAYVGAIAGKVSEFGKENVFVNDSFGGIDNVSYVGVAEPVSYEEILAYENTPDIFRTLTVRFEVEGTFIEEKTVSYGEGISELPTLERKDNQYWRWDTFDRDCVRFNMTVDGEWRNMITTLSSEGKPPMFLVEGMFDETARLNTGPDNRFSDADPESGILAAYTLYATDNRTTTLTVRYYTEIDGDLFLTTAGERLPVSYERDGRYIIFEMKNGGSFLYTEKQRNNVNIGTYFTIVTIVAAVVIIISIVAAKRKKRGSDGSVIRRE